MTLWISMEWTTDDKHLRCECGKTPALWWLGRESSDSGPSQGRSATFQGGRGGIFRRIQRRDRVVSCVWTPPTSWPGSHVSVAAFEGLNKCFSKNCLWVWVENIQSTNLKKMNLSHGNLPDWFILLTFYEFLDGNNPAILSVLALQDQPVTPLSYGAEVDILRHGRRLTGWWRRYRCRSRKVIWRRKNNFVQQRIVHSWRRLVAVHKIVTNHHFVIRGRE